MKYKTASELLSFLSTFDAKTYGKTRNHIGGGVSRLSPYITHGVITTKTCVQAILHQHTLKEAEKFLMELVRKEFFLQVQKSAGNEFTHRPVRDDKTSIEKLTLLPSSLLSGSTHTGWVNTTVDTLHSSGRLHNHQRMRLASRCCHRAKLDWKSCADWTYYHFLDGELSANHLSWQRVTSTFANKAYYMNEDNLQKYRPGTSDPDLRGSYDHVAERVFDPDRQSLYGQDKDMSASLVTPCDSLMSIQPETFDELISDGATTVRVLSPWRLDETLLADEIPTVVLLDETFTTKHPRSSKRLDFVAQYTQQHDVLWGIGSYEQILQYLIDQHITVILDERYDPVYREVQESFADHPSVQILPYPWINTAHPQEPIMKFFKYWNKTTRFIKELI